MIQKPITAARWREWGDEECTLQVLGTMRDAVKKRRAQSSAKVAAGDMLEAAKLDAEANAIHDLVAALEALAGAAQRCRGCGDELRPPESGIADCCPCNSARGVNHGIVPADCCTCAACDPAQTGASRRRAPAEPGRASA